LLRALKVLCESETETEDDMECFAQGPFKRR